VAAPRLSKTSIGVHSEGLSATHCLLSPERLLPLYPLDAMSRWCDRTQSYSLRVTTLFAGNCPIHWTASRCSWRTGAVAISPYGLLAIAKAARALLAVESEGAYPPIDRRVLAGLRTLGHIGRLDAGTLESGEPAEIAEVYVKKINPAWIKARKSQSAEVVDHACGAAGMLGD